MNPNKCKDSGSRLTWGFLLKINRYNYLMWQEVMQLCSSAVLQFCSAVEESVNARSAYIIVEIMNDE